MAVTKQTRRGYINFGFFATGSYRFLLRVHWITKILDARFHVLAEDWEDWEDGFLLRCRKNQRTVEWRWNGDGMEMMRIVSTRSDGGHHHHLW